MSLFGENYHYFSYGDEGEEKVRVEISKNLSVEDFLFWREQIINFLNNLDYKPKEKEASEQK